MQVCGVNVGTLRRNYKDAGFVKETRFGEKSVRTITGNSPRHKLFRIGNYKGLGVGIFLPGKLIDKVIYTRKVNDGMIFMKVLALAIIALVISVQVEQRDLNDSQWVL